MNREWEELVATVERAIPGWPAGLDECAAALVALAASDHLRERVLAELEAVVAEPTHSPGLTATQDAWVLWMGERGAKLTFVRVPAGNEDDAGHLTDSAAHQLIVTVAGDRLEVDLYTQATSDPEVMAPELVLAPNGRRSLGPGECLCLAPRRDVAYIPALPEARHMLLLEGPRMLTQQWVYARESLRPIASVAADPHDARLEAAMRLLRVLRHQAAVPALVALAAHPAHFVRWTAIRHTMALDPVAGLTLLRAATADPHPHVRAAAARAVASREG
jgi:hypothetical protein